MRLKIEMIDIYMAAILAAVLWAIGMAIHGAIGIAALVFVIHVSLFCRVPVGLSSERFKERMDMCDQLLEDHHK